MIKPIFKFKDNKQNIIKEILQNFPENYKEMEYVEPFCGFCTVCLNKEQSEIEVLNDLNQDVFNLNKILVEEKEEFCKMIKLKKSNKPIELCKDDLEKSVSYYLSLSKNPNTQKKEISKISNRLNESIFTNKKAIEIVYAFNNKNIFIFLDPPDWEDQETYSLMTLDDHETLSEELAKTNSKFMIVYKQHKVVKKLYKGFNFVPIKKGDKSYYLVKNY